MCGRFTQTFARDRADQFLGLSSAPLNLRPRYNVAAGQEAAVGSCGSGRPTPSFDAALGLRAGMGQGPAHRPQACTFGDAADQTLVPGRV